MFASLLARRTAVGAGLVGLGAGLLAAPAHAASNKSKVRALEVRVQAIEDDLEMGAIGPTHDKPSGRTAWTHPVLQPGRVAVITGASSGIGLAIAKRCAALGMKVVLADNDVTELEVARRIVVAAAKGGVSANVTSLATDVRSAAQVTQLKESTFALHGECALLVNNAGIGGGAGALGSAERWAEVIDTNLWGVINGVQAFVPDMVASGRPCAVVNTGSKQGITTPPGDTAYNVSKAGVKVLTEGLEHELRNTPGCNVKAFLLIPGWTNTSIALKAQKRLGTFDPASPPFSEANPAASAWSSDDVAGRMFDAVEDGKPFYVVCPDGEMSNARFRGCVRWNSDDIVYNRPPLSRWTPEHKLAFARATPAK